MAYPEGWVDIVRAWYDEEYRAGLTPDQLAGLPPKPENDREMSEEELGEIGGGQFLYTLNYFNYSNTSAGSIMLGAIRNPPPPGPGPGGTGG